MIQKYDDEGLTIANFLLALENNTMLKIILTNQVAIMRKLDMHIRVNPELLAQVVPGMKLENNDADIKKIFETAHRISNLYTLSLDSQVFDFIRIRRELQKDPDLGIKRE